MEMAGILEGRFWKCVAAGSSSSLFLRKSGLFKNAFSWTISEGLSCFVKYNSENIVNNSICLYFFFHPFTFKSAFIKVRNYITDRHAKKNSLDPRNSQFSKKKANLSAQYRLEHRILRLRASCSRSEKDFQNKVVQFCRFITWNE